MTNNNLNELVNKEIIIIGATESAIEVKECLIDLDNKVLAFADNSLEKQGLCLDKTEVISVEKAVSFDEDIIYLVVIEKYFDDIKNQLIKLGVSDKNILLFGIYERIFLKLFNPDKWNCEDDYYMYHNPRKKSLLFEKEKESLIKEYENKYLFFDKSKIHKKKYYISICAIFKDEEKYLKEWLDYHLKVGIEHFYLYNNNSSDDFETILKDYISKDLVTLKDWPYSMGQISAYVDCANCYKDESNWIGFIDIDEFVSPLKFKGIKDFFTSFENRGSVWIPWRIFGSSGLVERKTQDNVISSFFSCWPKHSDVGKCFWNTEYDISENKNAIMHHFLWVQKDGIELPPVNVFNNIILPDFLNTSENDFPIDIKHYVIKSLGEFETKMKKTDVFFSKNPHSMSSFYYHDSRCGAHDYKMLDFQNNNL